MNRYSKKILLKKLFKLAIIFISYVSGFYIIRRGYRKNAIRILTYHSINDHRIHEMNVKVRDFEAQMEYLSKNYQIIPLDRIVELLKHGKENLAKKIAITFDDGYMDNYLNAWPILKKYRMPATIFIPYDLIGSDKLYDHDLGDDPYYNQLLCWEDVSEMSNDGISVGSHTLTHSRLSQVPVEKAQREIAESKQKIESKIKKKVSSFAYPYGARSDYSRRIVNNVIEAGYECACTDVYGYNTLTADLFQLKRIWIDASDSLFVFKNKINGVLDVLSIADSKIGYGVRGVINRLFGTK